MGLMASKLELDGDRIEIDARHAAAVAAGVFKALGCAAEIAEAVASHLADSDLCGVESHGIMRTLQYADQFRSGYMRADARPETVSLPEGRDAIDGGGGIGIPAMAMAFDLARARARDSRLAAVSVQNVGHTGRHGAFADAAAEDGFLTICLGGGNRKVWRQVAPHGGAKAVLPTNPYCIGIPGGTRGPVVLDFATSKIAGGWIYAAQSAGALLPEGCVIDRHGRPTRDPADYFDGGAILPSGGHKGYALALVAELVAEALLGPVAVECNWLLLAIDTRRYGSSDRLQQAAEEILSELRACPPAPGFERVEIPGERERNARDAARGKIALPEATWTKITDLSKTLGV